MLMRTAPDNACERVFWSDPYRTRLHTRINTVEGNRVTLQRTIFFAFSGGQESDCGTIGGEHVLDARKDGHEIIYTLPDDHSLRVGQGVEVSIDWARRYRLMRLHLAAEIVLELVYRELDAIDKIGAHIGVDKARMDFARDGNIAAALPQIHAQATQLAEADQEIVSAFSDESAQRRYWQIHGFARVACGGTHLRRAGEIGALDLRRKNPGKGKERVEIALRHP